MLCSRCQICQCCGCRSGFPVLAALCRRAPGVCLLQRCKPALRAKGGMKSAPSPGGRSGGPSPCPMPCTTFVFAGSVAVKLHLSMNRSAFPHFPHRFPGHMCMTCMTKCYGATMIFEAACMEWLCIDKEDQCTFNDDRVG